MNRIFVMATLLGATACAPKVHRFADKPVVWVDQDTRHLEEPPRDYWSGLAWDGADQLVFRPSQRALGLAVAPPAANVNAWDEVPNSSWFENRIGTRALSDEELAQGSCGDAFLDSQGPWTVTAAKPNGANPGFIIRGPEGGGWLLKFDGLRQRERATTADVLGSRLYHAAGYHSPCNIIVFFDPVILEIDPDAETADHLGRDQPMTQADVDKVLAAAVVTEDGKHRASASKFLPGRPLGPWTYQGTRRDDPQDVVKHEDRRELRGANLMAAWTNHFDAREQNTLSIWAKEDGRTFVKHYYLDFGDTLGSIWWWSPMSMSRRFGYSYYFDAGDIAVDYLTLGTLKRPWNQLETNEKAPVGFFTDEPFDPTTWKPGYPNPSFLRMQPEDGAWMARIIARIDDHALQVMLDQGQMTSETEVVEIHRILASRRDAILEHYLQVRSPLADFRLDGSELCFTDLAANTGVAEAGAYEARVYKAPFRDLDEKVAADGLCVEIPELDAADPYGIVDIGAPGVPSARIHLINGDSGLKIVGIERPANDNAPGRR